MLTKKIASKKTQMLNKYSFNNRIIDFYKLKREMFYEDNAYQESEKTVNV